VTAFQKIIDATGELAGTTGYFFESGSNRGGRAETNVTGEICRAASREHPRIYRTVSGKDLRQFHTV
jgi:hypothetical protein